MIKQAIKFALNKIPELGWGYFFGVILAYSAKNEYENSSGILTFIAIIISVIVAVFLFLIAFNKTNKSDIPKVRERLYVGLLNAKHLFTALGLAIGGIIFLSVLSIPKDLIFVQSYQKGTEFYFSGKVIYKGKYSGEKYYYYLKGDISKDERTVKSVKILLQSVEIPLKYGEKIEFYSEFDNFYDKKDTSSYTYYYGKGINIKAKSHSEIEKTGESVVFYDKIISKIYDFSDAKGEDIMTNFPTKDNYEPGGLLKSLYLGDKSGLSLTTKNNLKHLGVLHYAAVSGTHLTIIICLFASLLHNISEKRRSILIILTVIFFIALFKFTPSVCRSGGMLIFIHITSFFNSGRQRNTISKIGGAIFGIMFLSPNSALDVGFQISIAATFGISVFSPEVCDEMLYKHTSEIFRKVSGIKKETRNTLRRFINLGYLHIYENKSDNLETLPTDLRNYIKDDKNRYNLLFSFYNYSGVNTLTPRFFLNFKIWAMQILIDFICIWLCIVPLELYYFGGSSAIGWAATLLLSGLFCLMIFSCTIFILLGKTGYFALAIAGISAGIFDKTVDYFGELPYIYYYTKHTESFTIKFFAISVLIVLGVKFLNKKYHLKRGNEHPNDDISALFIAEICATFYFLMTFLFSK